MSIETILDESVSRADSSRITFILWGPLVTFLAGIAIISPHVVQSEYNDNLGNYSTAIKVLACVVPLLAAAVA